MKIGPARAGVTRPLATFVLRFRTPNAPDARGMSDAPDPYAWRPAAVKQLRSQRRFREADAILQAKHVWQPENKTLEQWVALAAYLVSVPEHER